MKELAQLYREAQLYAHMAHNLASGPSFFEDHEFFADAYTAYEKAYDAVVERMIGQSAGQDLAQTLLDINKAACSDLEVASNNSGCLGYLLIMEIKICAQISKDVPDSTDGTQNLLQGLADESEQRQYFIQQRLK